MAMEPVSDMNRLQYQRMQNQILVNSIEDLDKCQIR